MKPSPLNRIARTMLGVSALLGSVISCTSQSSSRGQASAGAPGPVGATEAGIRDTTDQNQIQRENDEKVATLLAGIGADASRPAGDVFENVQLPGLKTVPARTFLSIMNGGYARALGVRCSHCHAAGSFASDEKRPKRAAREMAVMHRMINQELAKMQHLETPATQNRAISCIMCHRGTVDPRGAR
jgi:hypothetical protein